LLALQEIHYQVGSLCLYFTLYYDRLYNVEGFGDDSAVRFDRNLAVIQGDTINFTIK
jgi:hypothetical protein